MPSRFSAPRIAGAVAVTMLALSIAACAPEPDAAESPSPVASQPRTPSASPSTTAPPTAEPTASGEDIALPGSCDQLYSAAMRAELDQQIPPLNDPGVTMESTRNVTALQTLHSGVAALRCTWGTASERGIATTVALVDPAQSASISEAVSHAGFACDQAAGGLLCSVVETTVDFDDNIVEKGEIHFFRGNGWVSTVWLDAVPAGYAEDIAASLWG